MRASRDKLAGKRGDRGAEEILAAAADDELRGQRELSRRCVRVKPNDVARATEGLSDERVEAWLDVLAEDETLAVDPRRPANGSAAIRGDRPNILDELEAVRDVALVGDERESTLLCRCIGRRLLRRDYVLVTAVQRSRKRVPTFRSVGNATAHNASVRAEVGARACLPTNTLKRHRRSNHEGHT